MTRANRILWIVIGMVAVCAIVTAAALATAVHAVHTMPMIEVSVHEKGAEPFELHLTFPAAVVGAGLSLAPHVVPDEAWAEVQAEMRSELEELPADWRPALRSILAELDRTPDFTLVDVHDGSDHVRVDKRNGHLEVRVRSDDADVDVRLPLELIDRVAGLVEG